MFEGGEGARGVAFLDLVGLELVVSRVGVGVDRRRGRADGVSGEACYSRFWVRGQ